MIDLFACIFYNKGRIFVTVQQVRAFTAQTVGKRDGSRLPLLTEGEF